MDSRFRGNDEMDLHRHPLILTIRPIVRGVT